MGKKDKIPSKGDFFLMYSDEQYNFGKHWYKLVDLALRPGNLQSDIGCQIHSTLSKMSMIEC